MSLDKDELRDKLYEDLSLKQFDVTDAVHVLDYLLDLIETEVREGKIEEVEKADSIYNEETIPLYTYFANRITELKEKK